jgi:hypothetical protein
MGKRRFRCDTHPTTYRVLKGEDGYDVVRADPKHVRSRRAGVLDFVVYVFSGFQEVWKELTLKLKQSKEWFSMEREKNGCIRFKGTKKVLDYVEELGYRADLV